MAASENFKLALRAGNLAEAFAIAIGQAVELKISTRIIPSPESSEAINSSKRVDLDYSLQTRLNLIEGKIENQVGKQFLGDTPYGEIRQFHLEQVQQGHQTLANNLESLQKMFGLMASFQQGKLEKNRQNKEELSPSFRKQEIDFYLPKHDRDLDRNGLLTNETNHQTQTVDRSHSSTNGVSNGTSSETSDGTKSDRENGYFYPHTSVMNLDEEEEAIILSLEDLDPEPEPQGDREDEDWGDWMVEETNKDDSSQSINLKQINEDWTNDN
jgi:hypothetical protein